MRRLLRPTLQVTALNLGGQVVTFGVQLVAAALFGARAEMDGYLAALMLPSVLNAILMGSVGFVLIPSFIECRSSEGERAAWRLASSAFTWSAVMLTTVTAVGLAFRRPLLALTVPGLASSTLDLAADAALLLWPTLLLGGLSSVLTGLYQAEQRFVWQAFVPIVGACTQLAIVAAFAGQIGIRALGVAALCGAGVQLALLIPLLTANHRYAIRGTLLSMQLRQLAARAVPVVGSRMFSDATTIVDRYLASLLAVGTIARLNYASKMSLLTLSLFSTAIAITIFPVMSRAVAEKDMGGLRRAFAAGTRSTWLCYFPPVALATVLGRPLVAVFLQRGQFTRADTVAVATLLPLYMLSVAARALGNVSSRALYALKQTRLMAILNVASIAAYIAAVYPLVQILGMVGIPVAALLTDWLFYGVHYWVIWRQTGRVVDPALVGGVTRITIAAVISGGVSWAISQSIAAPEIVRLGASGTMGLLTYACLLGAFGVPEMTFATAWIRRRRCWSHLFSV